MAEGRLVFIGTMRIEGQNFDCDLNLVNIELDLADDLFLAFMRNLYENLKLLATLA